MYQPSPELQKRLDPVSAIEAKTIKHEQRRVNIMKGLAGVAVIGLFAGAHVSAFAADIRNNQELQATSIISVEEYGTPLDKASNSNALVFLDGFGSVDANVLTKYLSPAIQPIQDGRLWSVGYNDAPLSYEEIADQTIAKANTEGVTSISLVGESGGGSIAVEVADRIQLTSNISVNSIYLMFAPNGVAGLQPDHQDQMNMVEWVKDIPGVVYSTPARLLLELGFRSDDFTHGTLIENFGNFWDTAHHVSDSIAEKKLPGTWLMADQALQIGTADMETHIKNMGKAPSYKVRPTMIYVKTKYDPVVNDNKSSKELGGYAHAAGVPYLQYNVPGAVHGQPAINSEAYVKTFEAAKVLIKASIDAQLARACLHRITSMIPPKQN